MVKGYYITGPDGCGKTTLLNELKNHLQERGFEPSYFWLRSPKIISKPLMAYCRIVRLTIYKKINGIRYGDHQFYRSKTVSYLFPWLQLIDFKIKYSFNLKKVRHSDIVLFDRFSLDTLADLITDTERYKLHESYVGKSLIKIIPKNTLIVFLTTNEETIKKRKLDTLYDPQLGKKIDVYNYLSKKLNIIQIDNNRPIEFVKRDIFNYFDL